MSMNEQVEVTVLSKRQSRHQNANDESARRDVELFERRLMFVHWTGRSLNTRSLDRSIYIFETTSLSVSYCPPQYVYTFPTSTFNPSLDFQNKHRVYTQQEAKKYMYSVARCEGRTRVASSSLHFTVHDRTRSIAEIFFRPSVHSFRSSAFAPGLFAFSVRACFHFSPIDENPWLVLYVYRLCTGRIRLHILVVSKR